MRADVALERANGGLCIDCGIPLDAKHFDDSRIADAPEPGREAVLAQFELPMQYCGVIDYFAQFTDRYALDRSQVRTPGLQWLVLINRRPLDPYLGFEHIVNPWGYGGFKVTLRIDEAATVELVVRGVGAQPQQSRVQTVGGRLCGRYWYNVAYGDVGRRAF
jgi:hypothetical protein